MREHYYIQLYSCYKVGIEALHKGPLEAGGVSPGSAAAPFHLDAQLSGFVDQILLLRCAKPPIIYLQTK